MGPSVGRLPGNLADELFQLGRFLAGAGLEDLANYIQNDRGDATMAKEEPTLTNKDYFFDWEGD